MLFADLLTPDQLVGQILVEAFKAASKLVTDTGQNMLRTAVEQLANTPQYNPVNEALMAKYRYLAALGVTLSLLVAIVRTIKFQLKGSPERSLRSLLGPFRAVLYVSVAPVVIYYAIRYMGEVNKALLDTGSLKDTLHFSDLSPLDWLQQLVLSIFVLPIGFALTVEIGLFQFLGGLAMLASAFVIAFYGDDSSPFDHWWSRIVGLMVVAIFGQTAMLVVLVLSGWVIETVGLQTPNALAGACIGLIALGIAALVPFKLYRQTSRNVTIWMESDRGTPKRRPVNPLIGSIAGAAAGITIEHRLDELTAAHSQFRQVTGTEPPRSRMETSRTVVAAAAVGALRKVPTDPIIAVGLAAASVALVPRGPKTPRGSGQLPAAAKPLPPPPPPSGSGRTP